MAFIVGGGIFILFLLTSYLFLSRRASPVPYFPSHTKDITRIISALQLKNGTTIIDCGAGNGRVIMAAARAAYNKKLNTQFVALEINPILLAILYLRHLAHPNKQHIRVKYGNMFSLSFKTILTTKEVTVFYYISPWLLQQAYAHLHRELPRARVVSYFYALPGRTPSRTVRGIHRMFIYT